MQAQPVTREEGVRAKPFTNSVTYLRGTFRAGVGQDDCKLVAAKAGHDVGFTGAAANDGSRFDQRPTASQVSVLVVDAFETVEVHEEQRKRSARTRGALGFTAQHLVQVAGVVKLRKVVGDRERLRSSQPQRVIERLRRPLEHDPE